ncbi:hypothetical protein D3C84_481000 [compost metagenome]
MLASSGARLLLTDSGLKSWEGVGHSYFFIVLRRHLSLFILLVVIRRFAREGGMKRLHRLHVGLRRIFTAYVVFIYLPRKTKSLSQQSDALGTLTLLRVLESVPAFGVEKLRLCASSQKQLHNALFPSGRGQHQRSSTSTVAGVEVIAPRDVEFDCDLDTSNGCHA